MWPPSLAWYLSDSTQHTFSGSHRATVFQHPDQFADGPVVLGDVLEDLRCDDAVESAVGIRQVERVALDSFGPRRRRHLALVLHRLQYLVDVVEVGRALVERDHVGA